MKWFERRSAATTAQTWRVSTTESGLKIVSGNDSHSLRDEYVSPLMAQLADDGLAVSQSGGWLLPWDSLYEVLGNKNYQDEAVRIGVPQPWRLSPRLVSRGSLTDPHMTIAIDGWIDELGKSPKMLSFVGPVATGDSRSGLIPSETWQLLKRIITFSQRDQNQRTELAQRLAWGEIRRLAISANARLDDFLVRTVILAPEKLRIGLRRGSDADSSMVEVIPNFDGCPPQWLALFDQSPTVRDRYDIPSDIGIVQVVISPAVKSVLEQIRAMPGRRVSGARAEAFVINPFAALGEAASEVIDPTEFEASRLEAGLVFDRFTAEINRTATGTPIDIGIRVELSRASATKTAHYSFETDDEASEFTMRLRQSIAADRQLFAWRDYELELLGDAEDEAQKIDEAVSARVSIPSGAPTAQTIYDLSTYSDRILGIGEERPYASPYIAKKQEDGGWFPDNINALIELPPERPGAEPRYVSLDPEVLQRLSQEVAKAAGRGEQTIAVPGALDRISIGEAEDILSTFSRATQDAEAGRLAEIVEQRAVRKARKGLLIKPNIAVVDYLAERRDSLISYASVPTLPTSLLPKVELKQHQLEGVAWLQHLFGRSPKDCRGAVLADDMGLGKTLQLLTLIAWSREQDRELPPALIIAPVALLENWSEELHKFFDPKALPVLEVYGDTLAALRVPPHQVDEQLRRDGLVRFLRRNWVGDAKIVLTTYETLRDLEFSFAAERWSILVCDEAQKIKNPNALVTRAAKKQNARFRIACTGTPVENTLADLWCLFDLVQPGLLGALNEFGQRYRRPIEAQSQEEKLRVEELRGHIQPQILRRLKKDVARDLPKKIDVLACKALPLTTTQRGFYASAIAQYAKRNEPAGSVPFKNALGLLQYLRLICTDPRPHGMAVSLAASTDRYRKTSAKFDWLIPTLKEIQVKQEKALLFCEFRDIQRLLRHYISKELGYSPDIINGDTAASSKNEQSRQKRIRAFQNEPGFGAIILSPLAVGYGVNIQAANHVIHYTRTWNPAKEDQATDRAYRIGQRKDVYVYCPVVVANDFSTFDSKLDELLTRKRTLAEDMLNGAGDVGPGDFDIQEVAPFDVPGSQPRVLTIHDVICLRPRYFEAYVAVLWQRRGFPTVVLGPGAGDGGVDVVAIKGASGELVQCKTSQTHERALGWEAIKEVVGGEAAYRLRYPGVQFQKVCVSNVEFNETAKTQALHNNVRLVDRTELETIQAGQQISLEDIEKLIYRRW